MPLVVEAYECTRTKRGGIVLTFDPPDGFMPAGDLISAITDAHGTLTLTWASGNCARLPGINAKLAGWIAGAPVVSVRWMSDGLLRGSDLRHVVLTA
jgi:hypothetical protein